MKKQSKKRLCGIFNPFGKQQRQRDRLCEQSQRGVDHSPNPTDQEQATTNEDEGNLERDFHIPDLADIRNEELQHLLELMKNKDAAEVVLYGQHGVGKTWIAKEVTVRAIMEGVFDVSIWVYLNRKYRDKVALYESIARQLSFQLDLAAAEYYLDDDKMTEEMLVEFLKHKLQKKKCLLVLDDDGSEMSKEDIMSMLNAILHSAEREEPKILITRIKKGMDEDTKNGIKFKEIKPLSHPESVGLLRERIQNNGHLDDVPLDEIAKKCKCLPIAIVFAATALRYILKDKSVDLLNRKLAVQEAAKLVDEYWTILYSSNYEKFRNSILMQRCFWCSKVYLEKFGSIHYNELILYWMLEGCLSEITTEKAYTEGHEILMDLLDVGLLGQREAGDIVMERAGLHFADCHFTSLCEKTEPGFLSSLWDLNSLGNVKYMSDKIVALTSSSSENEQIHLTALLIDGNYFSREDLDQIFNQSVISRLLVLSMFQLQHDISIPSKHNLSVLILRDCNSLSSIDAIKKLKMLTALEISGSSALENIPDDFLVNFPDLQCLNLSGLSIQYFPRPSHDSVLLKLRSLILRRCSKLKYFPNVNGLRELEVLDLSGSTSLVFLNKKNEKFEGLPKLKMLDLSETNIYEFPRLDEVKDLTCLVLKRCPLLNKLKSLTKLSKLEVLNTSGSNKLPRIRELNLPSGDCLRKIDLSGTMIPMIPPLKNAANLIYLYLRNCPNLKELPDIRGAKSLQVIDLSGSKELENIKASFEEMSSLQELHLSQTIIKTLPPLSCLIKLRKLVLSCCELLTSLPEMGRPVNLQVLDLSGCWALTSLPDEPFAQMPNLGSLDLSRTCFSKENLSQNILRHESVIIFSDP